MLLQVRLELLLQNLARITKQEQDYQEQMLELQVRDSELVELQSNQEMLQIEVTQQLNQELLVQRQNVKVQLLDKCNPSLDGRTQHQEVIKTSKV